MTHTKDLGDRGEEYALALLKAHGYDAHLLPNNYRTYDIEVLGPRPFRVSVKTSNNKQHVRLGSANSVERLTTGDFVFAFVPPVGSKQIELLPSGYRLLIVPAETAKNEAQHLLKTYTEGGGSSGYSLMVKGYSRRPQQREAWARWASFEEAWDLLPVVGG